MYLFSKLEKTKKKGNKNAKLNDTKSEITQDKAGILAVCLEPTEAWAQVKLFSFPWLRGVLATWRHGLITFDCRHVCTALLTTHLETVNLHEIAVDRSKNLSLKYYNRNSRVLLWL